MAGEDFTARDFTAVLRELRGGMCEQDLREQLQKVTKACIETGKAGSVTLKLSVMPQGIAQALVKDDVKSVIPAFTMQPTVMFVDNDQNLTRRDPKQMRIEDLVVAGSDGDETVKVDSNTGEIIKLDGDK